MSEDFVSDKGDKIEFYQNFKKNFKNFFGMYIALDVLLILMDVVFTVEAFCFSDTLSAVMLPFLIFYYIISALYVGFTFKLVHIIRKYNKKIKTLKQEAMIFE